MFGDTREQNISLLRSSHQEIPGLEHELTERKWLRDEEYCTKPLSCFLSNCRNAETVSHPDNACINRRPHDPSSSSFAAIR